MAVSISTKIIQNNSLQGVGGQGQPIIYLHTDQQSNLLCDFKTTNGYSTLAPGNALLFISKKIITSNNKVNNQLFESDLINYSDMIGTTCAKPFHLVTPINYNKNRAVAHILINCIQVLSQSEYEKIYEKISKDDYQCYCIVNFNDNSNELYLAWSKDFVKAFLAKKITALNNTENLLKIELDFKRTKGIFYKAGVYQEIGGEIKPKYVNHVGGSQAPYQYIGVNNSSSGISYSEIKQNKSELSSYSEIWSLELDNSDPDSPAYMKLVSSDGGSGQDDSYDSDIIYPDISNSIQDNIIPALELDYTKGAMNLSSNYITDFSLWDLKFEGFSGYTEIVNQEELQKKKLDIFHRNIFNGEINKQVYIPVIKGSTQDCNLEEFLSAMDNLMNKVDINIDIRLKPSIKLIIYIDKGKTTQRTVNMQTYFLNEYENLKGRATFVYYEYNSEKDEWIENPAIDFKSFITASISPLKNSVVESESYTYSVDLLLEQEKEVLNLYSLELFEAYTRGHDFIQENYTTVRAEERDPNNSEENSRIMNYEDNYFAYKYSGRNIDITAQGQNTITLPNSTPEKVKDITIAITHSSDLLLESDVTLGESYGENKYFIEAIKAPIYEQLEKDSEGVIKNPIKKETGEYLYKDSFKVIDYLDPDNGGFDPKIWTDEDVSVVTGTIDLLQCKYYHPTDATYQNKWCDCSYGAGTSNKECLYQKLGYCPYRFESEKHPRRIRSLQQSKSNRFNLIQKLSTVFEIYPYFYIEHDERGKIILDENGEMKKHVFYMTEKGNEKNLGFRYEKNLDSVSRTLDSSSITTKLYVENVDSSYSPTGLNSIQTATDNIGKTSYILDFSYYVDMGMIEAERIQRDIYGIEKNDFAFLPRIGAYNSQYDKYSNLIITMTGETLTELQAQNEVSVTGIATALEERKKIAQTMYQFKTTKIENNLGSVVQSYTTSDTYKNYIMKYREQSSILWGLVEDLFYSNNYFSMPILKTENNEKKIYQFQSVKYGEPITNASGWQIIYNNNYNKYCKGELFWRLVMEGFENESYIPPFNKWIDFKEQIVDPMLYEINGNLGKYKSLYNEVKYWKNKRAEVLEKINKLSEEFYKKYEPYIKEGTFSDSNYLTDNEYYWAGVQVLSDSCAPKLSYNFSVIDLSPLDDDYTFELADSTFVEDIDFFGINKITGLPNRQKVIINEITYDLDNPSQNSIGVINYTSNFADLFESITASVQSLTFNENIYKRASNFTAKQYVDTDSLQGTLDIGDLTLLDTPKDNIVIDDNGTEGNDINNTASQYRITGQGVEFSTDGGETWDIGVGPKGINMDYAKFGSLDASKIQIVDGNYIYFLWDKDGINSYRNPATSTAGLVDFARFNRYGLSLIENNNVRLRAGYEYRSNANGANETGNYTEELPLTNQNIGFYLYNDQGQAIFKTETRSDYAEDNNSDYSARLSLTGEMFVTNKILDSDNIYAEDASADKVYEYSEEWHFNSEIVKTFSEYNRYFTSQSIIQEMITNNRTAFLRYNNNSEIGDSFYNSYFSIDVVQGPSTQENSLIYEEQQGSTPVTYQYVLTPVNIRYIDEPFNTQGDAIQAKAFNSLNIIKANFYSNNLLTFIKTTFTAEEVLSWFINNDFERDGLPQIVGSSSLQDVLNCDIEIAQSDDDVYKIAVRESLPGEAVELPVTNADIGNILTEGETNSVPTVETEATLKTTYNVESTLIEYTKENGDNEIVNLYRLEDGSYWKNKEDTGEVIVNSNSNFKNAEVGIFINNKKALNANDSSDKTNSSDQMISKENSDEQNAMAQEAILSGAERTFMISAISASKGDVSYNNILSVLKNGVLYMGGTVTDFYGKPLNISGLQYMPDEVRISEPSIVMSRNGQIWCDWSSFFLAFKQDGVYQYTTFSLMDFVSSISSWSQSASGGSQGTARVTGWYIDENKAGTI